VKNSRGDPGIKYPKPPKIEIFSYKGADLGARAFLGREKGKKVQGGEGTLTRGDAGKNGLQRGVRSHGKTGDHCKGGGRARGFLCERIRKRRKEAPKKNSETPEEYRDFGSQSSVLSRNPLGGKKMTLALGTDAEKTLFRPHGKGGS